MANDQPHTTSPQDRVPWFQLIAFGLGGFIPIALFNSVGQLMQLLGNISLGLSAIWLGTIMFVPRLWEAFSDPIIGHFSDNTRTRWGRRRPFILIGGIAVALSFSAMWWVPRGEWIRDAFDSDSGFQWFQLTFILCALFVFFTGCAVFEIPHGALGLEMSADPHERTRLFSAKSFLGNVFALATPWFIFFAQLEFFRGPGGDLFDGMRSVTLLIATALIPISFWWFFSLREPGYAIAKEQKKSSLWRDIRTAMGNRTFLILTGVVLILSAGFNFVNNFANYITIFYLYGGDISSASTLMGVAGMVWAFSALLAVFPLNWISRRAGKRNTMLLAILLMCAAQLSKIVCYRQGNLSQFASPQWLYDLWMWLDRWVWLVPAARETITVEAPYLILIPTMLLSAGMLMFFTLGASMVGDVCDEEDLKTGKRSEGLYFSVFWWFIKVGTALAIAVTGFLLAFTAFDERQNVTVEAMRKNVALIKEEAKERIQQTPTQKEATDFDFQIELLVKHTNELRRHFQQRLQTYPTHAEHLRRLIEQTAAVRFTVAALSAQRMSAASAPVIRQEADALLEQVEQLGYQSPPTLFRLRLFEIGLPLVLSVVSILLTLRYPLTEARSYEIKDALKKRRAERAT